MDVVVLPCALEEPFKLPHRLATRLKDYPQHILYRNLTSNHTHIRNYQSLRGTYE